jgi:hypothetical protein
MRHFGVFDLLSVDRRLLLLPLWTKFGTVLSIMAVKDTGASRTACVGFKLPHLFGCLVIHPWRPGQRATISSNNLSYNVPVG